VLAASTEVKGILGTDNRKYLIDLLRLSPRDLNFSDPKKYSTCLLRHELLATYSVYRNLEIFSEKMKKEQDEE